MLGQYCELWSLCDGISRDDLILEVAFVLTKVHGEFAHERKVC